MNNFITSVIVIITVCVNLGQSCFSRYEEPERNVTNYKVMIGMGFPYENGQNIEIVDLKHPNCERTILVGNPARSNSVAGHISNKSVICGGYFKNSEDMDHNYFEDCYIPGELNWNIYMLEKRGFASSIVINDTFLWIVGGKSDFNTSLNTSEFITLSGSSSRGPKLPFTVHGHCMVHINSSTSFLIGSVTNLNFCWPK